VGRCACCADDVLPKAHAALADLARLKTTDPAAFATQRDALRATLKQARDVPSR
jgi:hypothetical protein